MRRRCLLRWLRLPLWRGLHLLLLLLLLRRSGLMARGELGKFVVVIIVTFEASTRLELALTLPASFANQRGDLFLGLGVVVAPAAHDAASGRRRLAFVLDGRARILVVCGWEPSFHHLE